MPAARRLHTGDAKITLPATSPRSTSSTRSVRCGAAAAPASRSCWSRSTAARSSSPTPRTAPRGAPVDLHRRVRLPGRAGGADRDRHAGRRCCVTRASQGALLAVRRAHLRGVPRGLGTPGLTSPGRAGASTQGMHARRTKIVATLDLPPTGRGARPAHRSRHGLRAHQLLARDPRGPAPSRRRAARRRRAGRPPVTLLFDLQGPKIRLAADTVERRAGAGRPGRLLRQRDVSDPDAVRVAFDDFCGLVTDRSEIVIGDGVPRLMTESVSEDRVVARALSPGALLPNKGINVTYARPTLPAITEKDMADLDVAVEMGADFVALSFGRNAVEMIRLVDLLEERRSTRGPSRSREDRGRRAPRRDPRRVARRDGRAGRYGVEGVRARAHEKDRSTAPPRPASSSSRATQMFESMITRDRPEPTRARPATPPTRSSTAPRAEMLSAETSIARIPCRRVLRCPTSPIAAEEVLGVRSGDEPDVGGNRRRR